MNVQLWAELGIDYEKLLNQLKNKTDKGRILQGKINDVLLSYLKTKFKLSETNVTDVLRNIYITNKEAYEDLYVLCNSIDFFKDFIIKNRYRENFGTVSNSLIHMLVKSYFEDAELVRKIHYSSLLASKKLTSAVPDSEILGVKLSSLKEEDFEKMAKQIYTSKSSQKTINVWYVLREKNSVTVFIYKNCKARARIPSTEKRRHQFVKHSRPIILNFIQEGNLLEVFSRSNEQAYRMASKIISEELSKKNPVAIIYSQEEVLTLPKDLKILLDDCIDEKDSCPLTLTKLKCRPNEEFNDADIEFTKNRDSLKGIIRKVEKSLSTNIEIHNVSTIEVKYEDKKFNLVFNQKEDKYLVAYSSYTPDVSLNKSFKNMLEKNYRVKLVRRG